MFTSLFTLPFSWKGRLSIASFVFSKPTLGSATEIPFSFYSYFGLLLKSRNHHCSQMVFNLFTLRGAFTSHTFNYYAAANDETHVCCTSSLWEL